MLDSHRDARIAYLLRWAAEADTGVAAAVAAVNGEEVSRLTKKAMDLRAEATRIDPDHLSPAWPKTEQ